MVVLVSCGISVLVGVFFKKINNLLHGARWQSVPAGCRMWTHDLNSRRARHNQHGGGDLPLCHPTPILVGVLVACFWKPWKDKLIIDLSSKIMIDYVKKQGERCSNRINCQNWIFDSWRLETEVCNSIGLKTSALLTWLNFLHVFNVVRGQLVHTTSIASFLNTTILYD